MFHDNDNMLIILIHFCYTKIKRKYNKKTVTFIHIYWKYRYWSKLTDDTIVFWILFPGWLSFWNLNQISWLNNYMLEDTRGSWWIRSFCSSCHYYTGWWWLVSLHIHMRGRVCSYFACLTKIIFGYYLTHVMSLN